MAIHPTAIIDPQAKLDSSVEIGPYVVIEGPVQIGAHTQIRAHAYISGWTEIGERCDIHPQAVIGHYPQDFHYSGERSYCKIGNGVIIRESATIHRGTQPESSTVIGDGCFLLAYSHVGHNCILGKDVKVYNMAAVSGHVQIDDHAIISGYAGIHQFVRIGSLAFIAGGSRVTMDVPPFMTCYGEGTIIRYNAIGMQRAGYDRETIQDIRNGFRVLYRSGLPFRKAVDKLAETVKTEAGRRLLEFVRVDSNRGYCPAGTTQRARLDHSQYEEEC